MLFDLTGSFSFTFLPFFCQKTLIRFNWTFWFVGKFKCLVICLLLCFATYPVGITFWLLSNWPIANYSLVTGITITLHSLFLVPRSVRSRKEQSFWQRNWCLIDACTRNPFSHCKIRLCSPYQRSVFLKTCISFVCWSQLSKTARSIIRTGICTSDKSLRLWQHGFLCL